MKLASENGLTSEPYENENLSTNTLPPPAPGEVNETNSSELKEANDYLLKWKTGEPGESERTKMYRETAYRCIIEPVYSLVMAGREGFVSVHGNPNTDLGGYAWNNCGDFRDSRPIRCYIG